jgi:hypothetical protein
MSTTANAERATVVYPQKGMAGTYIILTATAALAAALAAFVTLSLAWAPWIMFMGWVAYYTRPGPSNGLQTFVCVAIGLALGAIATIATGALSPALGAAALPTVVFVVACGVIATRGLPVLNNLLGYFIGLITFFAAHQEPGVGTIAALAAAVAIGFIAGLVSQQIQRVISGQ